MTVRWEDHIAPGGNPTCDPLCDLHRCSVCSGPASDGFMSDEVESKTICAGCFMVSLQ